MILLFGLVTKNAILLVEAGAACRRPIIMTTLAMIFGMLPLTLGKAVAFARQWPAS